MLQLPQNDILPINKLVACFNNTAATYKYYWLLSIIDQIERGKTMIPKIDLFSGMVSHAWYTVNYFHISFGKCDLLEEQIQKIKNLEQIPVNESQSRIQEKLINSTNLDTIRALQHFDGNVPHWFLSPWFPGKSKKEIYVLSHDFSNLSPYSLHKEFISINLLWANYLKDNAAIIKSFCYWKLALFLQDKNPNVPDIPNKLIKPAQRNGLTKQRKQFWDLVIEEKGFVNCIYLNKPLVKNNYSVEHFVPYSFVSHDLIWNLIPADISFNSKKSDKLPLLKKHFDPFFELQKMAVEVVKEKNPNNSFLEDYLTIFPNLDTAFTKENFRERIQPLITIASNNGFEFM